MTISLRDWFQTVSVGHADTIGQASNTEVQLEHWTLAAHNNCMKLHIIERLLSSSNPGWTLARVLLVVAPPLVAVFVLFYG